MESRINYVSFYEKKNSKKHLRNIFKITLKFLTRPVLPHITVHLHYFSKIKRQKESQNSRIQGFSYYFCMMIEGSGSGSRAESGSKPLTSGSGSWRPKNTWIRWIRIRNNGHRNSRGEANNNC
jgi:hypothetical protein